MPGTVKSELLTYADRSHKCDSQEKVCWMLYLPLDKSHFITGFHLNAFLLYSIVKIPSPKKDSSGCLFVVQILTTVTD